MKTKDLGQNGPKVSQIGLGCMSLAGAYGPTDTETSLACLDAALESGITFYDTANIYGMGVSETILGQWLATRKPDVVLATKASIVPGPPRRVDNSESHLRSELEGSLRRLGRDHVELFYIHRRDPETPIEDVVGSLTRLMDEGKIGGYGLSECAASTLRRAHAVHPCTAVQSEYSLWTRQPELGMIQACQELGVTFVPFSPLGRGVFGDVALDPATFSPRDFRTKNPRFVQPAWAANAARIERFRNLAADLGMPTPTLAMAWILAQDDRFIPIPGTRTAANLAQLVAAAEVTLSADTRAEIDRLLPPGFAEGDRYNDDQWTGVERYC